MGRGRRTHYVGRRSQRTGEAVAIPAVQPDPSGQDRVTNLKKLHAKISLFHKTLGGSKIEVGVEGLPHGHLDNLDIPCFVLTLFQMSFDSPLCFKMKGHSYMTKVGCFYQKHLEMCIFCPQLGTD